MTGSGNSPFFAFSNHISLTWLFRGYNSRRICENSKCCPFDGFTNVQRHEQFESWIAVKLKKIIRLDYFQFSKQTSCLNAERQSMTCYQKLPNKKKSRTFLQTKASLGDICEKARMRTNANVLPWESLEWHKWWVSSPHVLCSKLS